MTIYEQVIKTINDELDKSYSHKPHLQKLPHDRRTNDLDKLQERIDAIDKELESEKELQQKLKKEKEDYENIVNYNKKQLIDSHASSIESSKSSFERDFSKMVEEVCDDHIYTLALNCQSSWFRENKDYYIPIPKEARESPKALRDFLNKGVEDGIFNEHDTDRIKSFDRFLEKDIQKVEKAETLKNNVISSIDDMPLAEIQENVEDYYGRGIPYSSSCASACAEYRNYVENNFIYDFDEKDNESTEYPRAFEVYDYCNTIKGWAEYGDASLRRARKQDADVEQSNLKIKEIQTEIDKSEKRCSDYDAERWKTETKMRKIRRNDSDTSIYDELRERLDNR